MTTEHEDRPGAGKAVSPTIKVPGKQLKELFPRADPGAGTDELLAGVLRAHRAELEKLYSATSISSELVSCQAADLLNSTRGGYSQKANSKSSKKATRAAEWLCSRRLVLSSLFFANTLEHLQAQQELTTDVHLGYAGLTVSRSAVEAAARSWWLTQPGLLLPELVLRAASLEIDGLVQAQRWVLEAKDEAAALVVSKEAKALYESLRTARSLPLSNEYEDGWFKSLSGLPVFNATSEIPHIVNTEPKKTYRWLSAAAHSTSWLLRTNVLEVPGAAGKEVASVLPTWVSYLAATWSVEASWCALSAHVNSTGGAGFKDHGYQHRLRQLGFLTSQAAEADRLLRRS